MDCNVTAADISLVQWHIVRHSS